MANIEKYENGSGEKVFTGRDDDVVSIKVEAGSTGNNNVISTDGGDDSISISGQNLNPEETNIPFGANYIAAGSGSDQISIQDVIGNDFVFLGPGDDRADLSFGDDTSFGSDGSDIISGGEGNDWVFGENGADGRLRGGSGNDHIFGGDGDDIVELGRGRGLEGGDGDDVVHGGNGNDLLNGGAGDDTLVGGAGKDIFYYTESDGKDTIFDFEKGKDEIRIYATSSTAKDVTVEGALIKVGDTELAIVQNVQELTVAAVDDYILVA